VIISIKNDQRDISFKASSIRDIFEALLIFKKIKVDELSVHFVTDAKMKKLHLTHFNDPSSTDCITFPIDDPKDNTVEYCVLGECFICPKTAATYASLRQASPYEELTLYCVHCFLHLLGYDDTNPSVKKTMRRQEKLCMEYLRKQNLILKEL
jgi:probable rRNA maturation factor